MKKSLIVLTAIIGMAGMATTSAHAKSYGSRPSVSRSYAKPKPAPRPQVIRQTNNRTTVVNRTIVQQAPASGGGTGIMGTILGSAVGATAGSMLGNHLSQPDPAPAAPAPVQQAPMQPMPMQQQPVCNPQFFDCTPKQN